MDISTQIVLKRIIRGKEDTDSSQEENKTKSV